MPGIKYPYLYKYQSFTKITIENLINRIIYFSNPKNFNDPFDCFDTINILEPTNEELSKVGDLLDNPSSIIQTNDPKKLLAWSKKEWRRKRKTVLKHFGIACFSSIAKAENILMWSHYADKHQGFCLEFNTQFDPFSKAEEVIYSPRYIEVPASVLLKLQVNPDHQINVTKLWSDKLTKSPCWEYEREYRLFDKTNKSYEYDQSALSGIYFGLKMPERDKKVIIKILKGSKTLFYNMKKVKGEFKLTSEPCNL
jgi:hypothetical protein